MESQEMKRMNVAIMEVRGIAEKARDDAAIANTAASHANTAISTHENICAIRYQNITMQLGIIPELSKDIKALSKWVYIGVGICMAIVGLSESVSLLHVLGKGD